MGHCCSGGAELFVLTGFVVRFGNQSPGCSSLVAIIEP